MLINKEVEEILKRDGGCNGGWYNEDRSKWREYGW